MRDFLLRYIQSQQAHWQVTPQLINPPSLGDSFLLKFGNPRTIVFAHMDTIGFMVRYGNQLIPIGGPEVKNGYRLVGEDDLGPIDCQLVVDEHHNLFHNFPRAIRRGTSLSFKGQLTQDTNFIQSPYLDNRLGLFNALKICETLKDGLIAFSCFEEQGGGSVPVLLDHALEIGSIRQALISDITWVTEGVKHGEGVVISIRDRNIPRRAFVNRLIQIAEDHEIAYQLEVEASGSSDGREVHESRHGLDWCFVGAPEDHVHTPFEKVHLKDLEAMIKFYQVLMKEL